MSFQYSAGIKLSRTGQTGTLRMMRMRWRSDVFFGTCMRCSGPNWTFSHGVDMCDDMCEALWRFCFWTELKRRAPANASDVRVLGKAAPQFLGTTARPPSFASLDWWKYLQTLHIRSTWQTKRVLSEILRDIFSACHQMIPGQTMTKTRYKSEQRVGIVTYSNYTRKMQSLLHRPQLDSLAGPRLKRKVTNNAQNSSQQALHLTRSYKILQILTIDWPWMAHNIGTT